MLEPLNAVLDHRGYYLYNIAIADFPGRHEPSTGKADWKKILTVLKRHSYNGFVGFEYSPAGDSDVSLKAIYDVWKSAEYMTGIATTIAGGVTLF